MSLLATVTEALGGYENLGGGYRQSTPQITSIPSRDGSVRQPLSVPNGIVPDVTGALRTSTARPGKMTNQRITYVRVQTQFPKECAHLDRVPVMEGDVVFVHRMDGMNTAGVAMGNDTARTSRIASVTQMNAMLANGNVNTQGELTMAPDKDPRGENPSPKSMNPVWERWTNCKTLARWTPDGVLASKEHDCVMDASNPGEAFNVVIGGPTLTRNSSVGDYPQHFDDGVRTLDKVFVGLIASENRGGNDGQDANEYFSFKYKLFTSRQLAWAPLGQQTVQLKDMERSAPGGDNRLGPSVDEFARMVQVWRIGSVFDNKSGMAPHRCATVNVVLEEWSLGMIQMEFNPFFGESLSLAPVGAFDAGELLTRAAAVITNEGASIFKGVEVLSKLYDPSFDTEVSQWKQVDAAWRDNVALADLRGKTAADYPLPTVGTAFAGQHGTTLGGKTFYMDGSLRLKAFYAQFIKDGDWCATCRSLFKDYISTLATVGRAASLSSQKKLMEWITKQGRADIVQQALKLHTAIMALRPILRTGETIAKGSGQLTTRGGRWPVA